MNYSVTTLYNMNNTDSWKNITDSNWYDNMTYLDRREKIIDCMVREHLKHFAEEYHSIQQLSMFVLWLVAKIVIGVLGLLGNTIVVLVLLRPQMRSSFNCLLLALAACDIATIVIQLLVYGLIVIYYYSGAQEHWIYFRSYIHPHVLLPIYPLVNITLTMSIYLTIIVSVERWMAVRLPFRAKTLFTYSRSRWYIFATVIFAFAYNAPRFFEMEIRSLSSINGTIYYNDFSNIFNPVRRQYTNVYVHWISLVVMFIVPFSVLTVMNACIVRQLHRARAERAHLTSVQRSELSLTIVMLADVLVFSFCNLPMLVNRCFLLYLPRYSTILLNHVCDVFSIFNNSVNFITYIIFGEKFRNEFLKITKLQKRKENCNVAQL